jgi:hypothetical protein
VLGYWLRGRLGLLVGLEDRLMLIVKMGEGYRCGRLLVVKQSVRLEGRRGMLRGAKNGWCRVGRGCRL